jgi:hypothetical protein
MLDGSFPWSFFLTVLNTSSRSNGLLKELSSLHASWVFTVKTLLESKRNRVVAFVTFTQYNITWNTCTTAQFMVFTFTHLVSGASRKEARSQGRSILKGGSAMSNEGTTLIVGRCVEEDPGTSSVVQEVFAAENCSAQCPTCQQSCDYSAGHAGLHHCPEGHEWI